jgi:hypothetical protein
MKKYVFFVILAICLTMLFSCLSTGNNVVTQQNLTQNGDNLEKLNPEDLFWKKMVGYNMAGSMTMGINKENVYTLLVNDDGTFELISNENSFSGNWSFEKNAKSYRYIFEWVDNEGKQGFNMDFLMYRNVIRWVGRRFEPDTNKTLGLQLAFE